MLTCDAISKGATVKFEVRRYWVDCLSENKQLWKEKAAKGTVHVLYH
jgi:hypothetical protein